VEIFIGYSLLPLHKAGMATLSYFFFPHSANNVMTIFINNFLSFSDISGLSSHFFHGNNEYPIKISTLWIVEAINEFLKTNGKQTSIRNIYLCDINRVAVDGFVNTLGKYFALVYNRP
jgi:superfamily I DNA and/or RNA helicase